MLREHTMLTSTEEDIEYTVGNINHLEANKKSTKIIHSFIPDFTPKDYQGLVESQISGLAIPEVKRLDLARDGHHYDIKTSTEFVQQIIKLLN
jgi:hypothetical protein